MRFTDYEVWASYHPRAPKSKLGAGAGRDIPQEKKKSPGIPMLLGLIDTSDHDPLARGDQSMTRKRVKVRS